MDRFHADPNMLVEIEEIVHRYRLENGGALNRAYGSDAAVQVAREVYRARRARTRIFSENADLFGEPAWDIMLDMFAAGEENATVSVKGACIAAAVPPTTALRWLAALEARGLLVRTGDPADARRCHLKLTDAARRPMEIWLAQHRRA